MTTDTRPVWLLDVDGVINATRPGWGAPPVTRSVTAYGQRWRMRFAPQLIARIAGVHAAGLVEVRWATSWVDHVVPLASALGLPPGLPTAFTFAGALPATVEIRAAKLTAALDVVDSGRPLIWTDDDAIPVDGDARAVLDRHRSLLIAPKPSRGLRPEHLDEIDAFTSSVGVGQRGGHG